MNSFSKAWSTFKVQELVKKNPRSYLSSCFVLFFNNFSLLLSPVQKELVLSTLKASGMIMAVGHILESWQHWKKPFKSVESVRVIYSTRELEHAGEGIGTCFPALTYFKIGS